MLKKIDELNFPGFLSFCSLHQPKTPVRQLKTGLSQLTLK